MRCTKDGHYIALATTVAPDRLRINQNTKRLMDPNSLPCQSLPKPSYLFTSARLLEVCINYPWFNNPAMSDDGTRVILIGVNSTLASGSSNFSSSVPNSALAVLVSLVF